jgi:hypothetical protein
MQVDSAGLKPQQLLVELTIRQDWWFTQFDVPWIRPSKTGVLYYYRFNASPCKQLAMSTSCGLAYAAARTQELYRRINTAARKSTKTPTTFLSL